MFIPSLTCPSIPLSCTQFPELHAYPIPGKQTYIEIYSAAMLARARGQPCLVCEGSL